MLLTDMMIDAIDASLEDREVSLDRISVNIVSDILANAVIDHSMLLEPTPEALCGSTFVGHDKGCFVNLSGEDRTQGSGSHGRDVVRTHPSASLDQREDCLLARSAGPDVLALAAVLVLFQAADERLIDLDRLAFSPKRLRMKVAHALADTVPHEPCRFIGHPEHAVQLVRRHALLAGTHKPVGERPLVERNMASFHNGPDRDGESLVAVVAVD